MEFLKNDASFSVQVVMNDHGAPKFTPKFLAPLGLQTIIAGASNFAYNKVYVCNPVGYPGGGWKFFLL